MAAGQSPAKRTPGRREWRRTWHPLAHTMPAACPASANAGLPPSYWLAGQRDWVLGPMARGMTARVHGNIPAPTTVRTRPKMPLCPALALPEAEHTQPLHHPPPSPSLPKHSDAVSGLKCAAPKAPSCRPEAATRVNTAVQNGITNKPVMQEPPMAAHSLQSRRLQPCAGVIQCSPFGFANAPRSDKGSETRGYFRPRGELSVG